MTKVDRRITRTRRQFCQALLDLLRERGSDQITVQEIADRADLSRATFYLHYKDKDDLLIDALERLIDPLLRIKPLSSDFEPGDENPALRVFEHVAQHHDLYKATMNTGSVWRVAQSLRVYSANVVRSSLDLALNGQPAPFPVEVLAQHMVGSMQWLIVWWLENDMPYSAVEMATMYQTMNRAAVQAALGHQQPNA